MNQNYFTFNNEFYQQLDDTELRNALSQIIADLFMSKFEEGSAAMRVPDSLS